MSVTGSMSTIMPGPVCDKGDQPLVRPIRRTRQHLVEQPADRNYRIEVRPFGVAAHIVGVAHSAFVEDHK